MFIQFLRRIFTRQATPQSQTPVEPLIKPDADPTPEDIAENLKTYLCANKLADFKACLGHHKKDQPQPTYKGGQTLFHLAVDYHSFVPNLGHDCYDRRGAAILEVGMVDMQPFMDAMVDAGFDPHQVDRNGRSPLAYANYIGKKSLVAYIEQTLPPRVAQQSAPTPGA